VGIAVRSIDLDHLDPSHGEMSGETGAPTAGCFDTDPVKRAVAIHLGQQTRITGAGRRERFGVKGPTGCGVAHSSDIHVIVRVDAACDATVNRCHRDGWSFRCLSYNGWDWEGRAQLGQNS
jgi:hypothetical protein